MANKKTLEKKIWRVIPVEAHKLPYINRMRILANNVSFKDGNSRYRMPLPETDFEKEIYEQFQELVGSHDIARIEYVVPLIKEFVIDNKQNEAAILFRYQMDFAIGKGFQMKEMVFYGKKGEKLKEIYEDHAWTEPSSLDYPLSQMAKIHMDPMLYLLRGNILRPMFPDYHGLEMDDKTISITPEYGDKITLDKR
ncbi:MAG: hypothetical protein WC812_02705 [Candidatus Pacearchaeota archaeon]|jgi:hypothetical protein